MMLSERAHQRRGVMLGSCKQQTGSFVVFATFHERSSSMKRYILTGTPGSGKTSLLHALKSRGYSVVEEAATDVIALEHRRGHPEPWMQADFIDKIIRLQKQR